MIGGGERNVNKFEWRKSERWLFIRSEREIS